MSLVAEDEVLLPLVGPPLTFAAALQHEKAAGRRPMRSAAYSYRC
jgi:hypothetical protein